ncbi:hypothetical protein DFH09DRAFT_1329389 [Mycena vulgaris]|nr:hypothetical protein DFH09DRAFT_1329389 [Mycena vulgaris]
MRYHHPGQSAGSSDDARLCRPDATGGAGPLGRGRAMGEVYIVTGSAAVDNDLGSMGRGRGAEARRGRTANVHLAHGDWVSISPRATAVTAMPRSSFAHHRRPAHKRPARAHIAHGIARCICLPALASFAPSPSHLANGPPASPRVRGHDASQRALLLGLAPPSATLVLCRIT